MFDYCISRGPGTLIAQGEAVSMEDAEAAFDVASESGAGQVHKMCDVDNNDIRHLIRERFSMTIIPVEFAG